MTKPEYAIEQFQQCDLGIIIIHCAPPGGALVDVGAKASSAASPR